MILTVFVVVLCLSLFFLVAGKYIDAPPLQIAGYTILFLLGLTLMLGGVSYKSGEVTDYSFACGCCVNGTAYISTRSSSGVCDEDSSLIVVNETITDSYSNYSGEVVQGIMLHHIFGLLVCLLSALGFVLVFFNLKGGFRSV